MSRKKKATGVVKAWNVEHLSIPSGTTANPHHETPVGTRLNITIQLDYSLDATMNDLDKAAKAALRTWIKEKS